MEFPNFPRHLDGSIYTTSDNFEIVIDFSVAVWGQRSIEVESRELTDAHVSLIEAAASPDPVD